MIAIPKTKFLSDGKVFFLLHFHGRVKPLAKLKHCSSVQPKEFVVVTTRSNQYCRLFGRRGGAVALHTCVPTAFTPLQPRESSRHGRHEIGLNIAPVCRRAGRGEFGLRGSATATMNVGQRCD